MSILSLQNVTLKLGGHELLTDVSWQMETRDHIALVGRNGVGKSSLLKLLQQDLVPDRGRVILQNGLKVANLHQNVPEMDTVSVYQILTQGLGEAGRVLHQYRQALIHNDAKALIDTQFHMDKDNLWKRLPEIEATASQLGIDIEAQMASLSGGLKRRVMLASALISEPDLLLLDEPTNHLDLPSIEWLETYLKNFHGALLFVTHDREFLKRTANKMIELDRGHIFTYDCSYDAYLERREARLLAQEQQDNLFDKRLADEEAWIRQGVKARRTRNEGRVRALKAMREARKNRRQQLGKIDVFSPEVNRSGQLTVAVEQVSLYFGDKPILKDFNLLLQRGDKVGIIGPNGCGKTTLIRTLLGDIAPDKGKIMRGTNLEIAYFDQLRSQLDDTKTVMANVADGADFVTINGQSIHVATWLRQFLFPQARYHQQVSTLSGGERNRLMLAKLLAKPVNLLVMDEPTNDLDLETLEVLEDVLSAYSGTLLLISHDRMFIEQVVSSVLVYEAPGIFQEYVGGYEQYLQHKQAQLAQIQAQVKKETASAPSKSANANNNHKLSYQEQRELARLPDKIDALEKQITELQLTLSMPEFYQKAEAEIAKVKKELSDKESLLEQMLQQWEILEAKK